MLMSEQIFESRRLSVHLSNEGGTVLERSSVLGLHGLSQCPRWWLTTPHNSVPVDRGRAAHCRIGQ